MRPTRLLTVLLVAVLVASLCIVESDATARKLARSRLHHHSRHRAHRDRHHASDSAAFLQQKQNLRVQQDIKLLQTVAISSEAKATAEEQAILNDPAIQKAINARTPDAVDRLIQDILVGRGNGGVVTSEFNQGGVHATIISNVNQLKVTTMDNSKEQNKKAVSEQRNKQTLNQQLEDTDKENDNRDKAHAKAMAGESPESSEESSNSQSS